MGKVRKILAFMGLLLAVGLGVSLAAPVKCRASSGLVQIQSKTRLDVGKGNIEIGPTSISGISPEGKQETQVNSEGYQIVGETGTYSILVKAGVSTEILLDNVNISLVDTDAYALKIEDASTGNVTVKLRGQNVLKGGSHCAGLEKGCNQTSCVRDGNSCTCGTLTIQCEKYREGHVCDGNCGSLVATGVNGAAGIGGGNGRKANYIQILGGHISASGGYGGAGIGGGYFCAGSHVEIKGGEVTAVAGEGNVALGGLEGSDANSIIGDCIVEAGSTGGLQTVRGILLNGNSATIYGVVNISRDAASGILREKTLTKAEGGRLVLPDGVSWTVQNTLKITAKAVSSNKRSSTPGASPSPSAAARKDKSKSSASQASGNQISVNQEENTASAEGIYGQTLNQLKVTDQKLDGDPKGKWHWAAEEKPNKTYPMVNGITSYTRVFTPKDSAMKQIQVEIVPRMSFLETDAEVTILSPNSPDGENGWYKGNVILEAPDGYQAFHSREVGWVEELVVSSDGGSGDYEYYLREVGTNLTTGVKTIRLKIDSLPPILESVTVTNVGTGMRIRAQAKEDTSLTEQVSGTRRFYCLVRLKSKAKTLGRRAVVKNKNTKDGTTGEFTYSDLEKGQKYQLYMVAADEAGNLSKVETKTFTAK